MNLSCEAKGCNEPAQYFPADFQQTGPPQPDKLVGTLTMGKPHQFCPRHNEEWERTKAEVKE